MDNIKKILEDVFGKINLSGSTSISSIDQLWIGFIDQNEKKHTKLEGINQGNLMVVVDTPAWMQHMKTRRDCLLGQIKEKMPEIKQISFRLGKIK